MINVGKKFPILLLIIIFLISFNVILVIQVISKISAIQNSSDTSDITTSSKKTKDTYSLNDIYQYAQKEKAKIENSSINSTNVTFTYKFREKQNTSATIDVFLANSKPVKVDSADFSLTFDSNIQITGIEKGVAFPIYPRITFDSNSLTITGATIVKNNLLTLAEANSLFATIKISYKAKSAVKELRLEPENTNIYFMGKSVFSVDNTFKTINL
jgi:hypothetical protein